MNTKRATRISLGLVGLIVAVVGIALGLLFMSATREPSLGVSGTVRDAKTGEPIAGARVGDSSYGPEPRRGSTTDKNGSFSFTTWDEEHNVEAAADGYVPQVQVVSGGDGPEEGAHIEFSLQPVMARTP